MNKTIDEHKRMSLESSRDKRKAIIELLETKIQSCDRCELHKLFFNKFDISKGFGKLLGWKGGKEKVKYFFVGLNPSYNRFMNLKYAFGGVDFYEGTGTEFVKILKNIGIIEESYVTNIVKYSSSDNDINEENFKQCVRFFKIELALYTPKIVISLGKKVDDYLNKYGNVLPISVKYANVFHPNYVISYRKELFNDYVEMIKEVTIG